MVNDIQIGCAGGLPLIQTGTVHVLEGSRRSVCIAPFFCIFGKRDCLLVVVWYCFIGLLVGGCVVLLY